MHGKSILRAVHENAGSVSGLSQREAERRLLEHGPNQLADRKKASPVKLLLSQFTDIVVIILMISTAISAFMGKSPKLQRSSP